VSLRALLLAVASVVSLTACGPKHEVPKIELQKPPSLPSESSSETGGTDDGEVWEGEAEMVIEVAGDESAGGLPNTPVEPEALKVSWTPVEGGYPASLRLLPVASGVVARAGDAMLELGEDGSLETVAELAPPVGELVGDWPEDVWLVEAEEIERKGEPAMSYGLSKLEGGAWVKQKHRGDERWVGSDLELRRSWHKGFIVREGSHLSRLGSPRDNPKIGPRMGKEIRTFVETRSGKIYSVSERKTGVYAQRDCQNFDCVEENATKLPYGKNWRFPLQVPRQRNSVSLFATVENGGVEGFHLLHYETGGWKLESLVHAPDGMWPTPEGGLWILVHGELWYRSPKGHWVDVSLPKGISSISAAAVPERGELWLAGELKGQTQVLTTTLEPPVPADEG
jgi:hypothetical protein